MKLEQQLNTSHQAEDSEADPRNDEGMECSKI